MWNYVNVQHRQLTKRHECSSTDQYTYLCVRDDCHPVGFLGPRNTQHCPKEDGDRKQQRQDAAVHQSVEYHGKVAQSGRVREKDFTEGDQQTQNTGHVDVKTLLSNTTSYDLLVFQIQPIISTHTHTHDVDNKISPVGDWRSTSLEWRFSILDRWIESDIPSSITHQPLST